MQLANDRLASLLPEWHLLLQGWSADGRLTAAAQEALLLNGEPQALTDLTKQWAAGEFGGLPPIVLLSAADINGALGAYAISTGTIYLNADWLAGASKEQVIAVLTEELGHHLDGLLNAVDTPGDEGEFFSALLSGKQSGQETSRIRKENDTISITLPNGIVVTAEAARIDGTEADDTLMGDGFSNEIYGYGGNDTINGEAGADLIDGGDGNDIIDGSFGNDTLYGGAGDDNLTDSQGANLLDGGDGNDSLTSKALTGNHSLFGGIGNDWLTGTGQTINLDGGAGQDSLVATGQLWQNNTSTYVQRGSATLIGGDGDDGLSSQYLENALLQGNDGNDNIYVYGTKNSTLEGGVGNDYLLVTVENYTATREIGAGYGVSHHLDGGSGDDSLQVNGNGYYSYGRTDLVLDGGSGNDSLLVSDSAITNNNGAFSTASLAGGDGDDTLTASGVLQLTLSGGTGRDRFVLTALQYKATQASYNFYTDSNFNSTTVAGKPIEITDFQAGFGGDLLDLKDLLENAASGFDGSNPFGASGYLRLIQSLDNSVDSWLQ
jgi:Ca2+-binding RTX toxin-like protein